MKRTVLFLSVLLSVLLILPLSAQASAGDLEGYVYIAEYDGNNQFVQEIGDAADFTELIEGHRLAYVLNLTNTGTQSREVTVQAAENGESKTPWKTTVIAAGETRRFARLFSTPFAETRTYTYTVNGETIAEKALLFTNGKAEKTVQEKCTFRVCLAEYDENGAFCGYLGERANFAYLDEGHYLAVIIEVTNISDETITFDIAPMLDDRMLSGWQGVSLAPGQTQRFGKSQVTPLDAAMHWVWYMDETIVSDVTLTVENQTTDISGLTFEMYISEYDEDSKFVQELGDTADYAALPEGHCLGYTLQVSNPTDHDVKIDIRPSEDGKWDNEWEDVVVEANTFRRFTIRKKTPFTGSPLFSWYVNDTQVVQGHLNFSSTAAVDQALTYEMYIAEVDENRKFVQNMGTMADFAALPEGHFLSYALVVENASGQAVTVDVDYAEDGEMNEVWTGIEIAAYGSQRFTITNTRPFMGSVLLGWYVNDVLAVQERLYFDNSTSPLPETLTYEVTIAEFDEDRKWLRDIGDTANFTTLEEGHTLGYLLYVENTGSQTVTIDEIDPAEDGTVCNGWPQTTIEPGERLYFTMRYNYPAEEEYLCSFYVNGQMVAEKMLHFLNHIEGDQI